MTSLVTRILVRKRGKKTLQVASLVVKGNVMKTIRSLCITREKIATVEEEENRHCREREKEKKREEIEKRKRLLAVVHRQWLDPTVVAVSDFVLTARTTVMKHMREACSRIDRNRQVRDPLYRILEKDGIPVDVGGGSGGCSMQVSALVSRRVDDVTLVLETDPAIQKYPNIIAIARGKKKWQECAHVMRMK